MTRIVPNSRFVAALLVVAVTCVGPSLAAAQDARARNADAPATASEVVGFSHAPGGICAVVGAPDAGLALDLAARGSFVVHSVNTDPRACDAVRKAVRSRGMYGTVSAGTFAGRRLPYADNLINVVVVDSYPSLMSDGLSPDEVIRVLAAPPPPAGHPPG